MNAALDSVRHGETWGVIGIGQNFTQDLFQRYGMYRNTNGYWNVNYHNYIVVKLKSLSGMVNLDH